jgi:hypothetical protein
MERKYLVISGLIVLLTITIFIAGCSNSSASNSSAQSEVTGTVIPAATSGPLYTAGDILKNPKSSSVIGVLIVSYDAATDMYERALIYPNSDGSWGYRMDSRTDSVSRMTIEKVYTVKVTNIALSSIPIGTPAVTATPVPAATTLSSSTVTPTSATSAASGPKVLGITPDTGYTGTSVAVTGLTGNNFLSGATVQLVNSGSPGIAATGVSVVSASDITCTFAIPSNASVGAWDVQVTNTNGNSGSYANGFIIRSNPSITTTTTAATTAGNLTVTGIAPSAASSNSHSSYTITGTNFVVGATVKLTSSIYPDIRQFQVSATTPTSITVWFDIPQNYTGNWNVVVINPDGTSGTFTGGLTIH